MNAVHCLADQLADLFLQVIELGDAVLGCGGHMLLELLPQLRLGGGLLGGGGGGGTPGASHGISFLR